MRILLLVRGSIGLIRTLRSRTVNARLFFVLLVSLYVCFGVRGQGDSTDNLLQINAIYPSGEEVASGERITLEFNQDMVSLIPSVFADEVVPIEIEPTLDCDWVWIESNSLKCDLPDDTDLMDATKYEVTVRPEFSSLLGQVMVEQFEHTFITKLPVIVSSKLRSWMSPTQPIIEVEFDQDINLRSAQDNILLIEKSSLEEFPVKVWPYSRDLRYSLNKDKYGRMQTYKKLVESDEPNNVELNTDRVLLLPERPLPDGINVSLVLLPGIEGAYGNVATNNRTIVDTEITTLGEFQLLGLVCEGVDGEDILIAPGQSDDSACDASSNFAIVFSSPIDRSIERLIKTDPDARQIDRSDWPLMSSLGLDEDYPPEFFGYKYWFRSDFKPGTDYQLYVGPKTVTVNQSDSDPRVQDGFDRSLIGTNVFTFRTAHSSPKIVLERSWIVVDSNSSFDPRLYARNVEDVVVTYDLFDKEGEQRNLTLAKASPNLDDILHSQNLGLRSALRSSSGFMFGSISGRPRFDHVEESVADYFDVLATPYSILVKVRDFSALVWVVDLHTGEPVSNAEVKLFQGDVSDYSDTLEPIASGLTDANGLITFQTRQSTNPDWLFSKRYSIRVEGKEGIAMMPVIDDFEYQEEYFSDPKDVNIEQWITTLQPLYEPGDTVHIKGYIRDISESNLEIPDGVDFALCIDGGDLRVHQDVTLNQFGSFHLSHKLNEYSSFGIYDVRLVFSQTRPINDACSYLYREENYDTPGVHVASGGSFEVYEFETNPVQISLELNSETFQRGDRMSIVTSSQYFDGKPNAQGTGSVEIDLMPGPPPIKTVDVTEYEFSGTQLSPTESSMFERRSEFDIVLNDEGKHTLTYVSLNDDCYYGTFRIESSVNSSEDDHVATRTMAGYYGVDQFVGIRQPVDSLETRYEEWTVEKIKANKPWPVEVLVVSKEDEIVAGKVFT